MGDGAKKILIIDDDENVRLVIEKVAVRNGVDSVVSCAGPGIETIISSSEPFDLVFLDLLLPVASGWEILDMLADSPACKSSPVVIVTGAPISNEEKLRLRERVLEIVDKETFSLSSFEETLARVLNRNT